MVAASFDIVHLVETLSVFGLFFWFALYNILIVAPLPPIEIVLLTTGYILSAGNILIIPLLLALILGMLLVHVMFFSFSKTGNTFIQKYLEKFGKSRFITYKSKFQKKYFKSYIFLLFIPKIRVFAPVVSGSINTPWKKFLATGVLANTLFISFYVFIGFFFHKTIQAIVDQLRLWQNFLFYLLMLILIAGVVYLGRKLFLRFRLSV